MESARKQGTATKGATSCGNVFVTLILRASVHTVLFRGRLCFCSSLNYSLARSLRFSAARVIVYRVMKVKIANILTGSRIILSFCLLLFKPLTPMFLFVYICCGLTDVLDGFVARKLKVVSKFGAHLDSIADACFLMTVIVHLVPIIKLPMKLIVWIILIALVRLLSIFVAFGKFHTFTLFHTYANKCTGLLLFFVPLFLITIDIELITLIVCTVATFSATEELIINLLSKEWNADIRGLADLF